MNELLEKALDYLLQYQDQYKTGEPATYVMGNSITIIYNTSFAKAMFMSVLNSVELLQRIHYINLSLSDIVYTDTALIIEYSLFEPQ